MHSDIHKLLLILDHYECWEYPRGHKKKKAMKEIEQIKNEFESLLNVSLDLDRYVEDASFLTDLGLIEERIVNQRKIRIYPFCFRFSNFGRLFTLIGELSEGTSKKYQLDSLTKRIEQKGFVFIPYEELDTLYNGINQPPYKGFTWWTRYFDYL
ncbi:hypothetical protein QNI16_05685 [Cytophagaceae bacterium YF14B1]|uniref:Uncharacterized protein n=1 Tax=Xanthocytophaga flava TaxID=3048013 RepID=A0AAE3U4Q9_9BACT|nr:hypothetical protein [Xanthocytophaga flavus]MDJ1479969.1 hypothetical protein [Xanthocytophaga flavus]